MSGQLRQRALAAAGGAALCLAIAGVGARAAGGSALPPGCHVEWPVVGHGPAEAVVPLRAGTAPIACAVETGFATSESTIAVSNLGSLLYSPAGSENTLARSTDSGAGWSLAPPPAGAQQSTLFNTVDPQVIVDRRTGRLFWVHATGPDRTVPGLLPGGAVPPGDLLPFVPAYGFQVYSSADDGRSWSTADYQTAPMGDWEKIFTGPPRPAASGAPQPAGYPNVVYVCANSPLEASGPSRLCYRSLDGGGTFAPAGYVVVPGQTLVCPPLGTNTGVVDSDGTTYQPESCQDAAYLAVSADEGATYAWVRVPTAPANNNLTGGVIQLAIDGDDNLYVLWVATDRVYYSVSRDRGKTWEGPVDATAPGVSGIALPAFAASGRGALGITYYGHPGGAKVASAYITESTNALAAKPFFYSAAINPATHPVFNGSGLGLYPRADYVGGAFDAGGQFWAGVVEQLGAPDANNNVRTSGYVGRLVPRTAVAAPVSSPAMLPSTARAPLLAMPLLLLAAVLGILSWRRHEDVTTRRATVTETSRRR